MKLVLIADDEAALLEVLATVVSGLGHRPLCAHDGREALALTLAHRPDLIISDHMMPGLTGVNLLRTLRAEGSLRKIPFVLMSAARPAGAEEADLFIAKPMSLERMERAVEEGLQRAAAGPDRRAELLPDAGPDATLAGAARADLLAWVAHEVKTPLSSARLNLDLLVRDLAGAPDEALRRRARSALTQLGKLDELLNAVLEASRLSDGKVRLNLERTDLRALLQRIADEWRDARADFDISLELPAEDVVALIDPLRVRQILDNLVSNAIKYSAGANKVDLSLSTSPGRAIIQVRDHGVGIDASELPRVFDRFHRADDRRPDGHGLGLYISSGLAALHGGTLHAKSERGQGSTFTLSLPIRL